MLQLVLVKFCLSVIDIEVSILAIVCPCLFTIGTVPVIGLCEVKVGKLSEALNKNF